MNVDNLKIKSVVFDKEGTTTIIGKSAEEVLGYEDPKNILIDVAYCLDGNHTLNEIILTLRNNNIDISKEELKKIIKDIFIKNNLILDNSKSYLLSEKQLIKYDRLLLFFASYNNIDYITAQEMQKKLFDANVLVLGVGGTGGHTAHSLVASGVGNITLLDYDEIELTNVTRQMLYKEGDIGKKKIDIAKKRLQEINPEANITTINKQIFNKEQIQEILGQQKYDFVVNTMDNPRGEIRYIVDEAIYDLEIPYIYNGSSTSTAIVGPMILKGKTKKYGDLIPNHENSIEKISRLNDKLYVTTVIEPLNGSVGQFTAFEVIKYITGCANPSTFATRIALNMDTMEIDKYEL